MYRYADLQDFQSCGILITGRSISGTLSNGEKFTLQHTEEDDLEQNSLIKMLLNSFRGRFNEFINRWISKYYEQCFKSIP